MDIKRIIRAAEAIKERVEAASVWDEGEDSPMRCISTIDEHIVIILHELGVPGYENED